MSARTADADDDRGSRNGGVHSQGADRTKEELTIWALIGLLRAPAFGVELAVGVVKTLWEWLAPTSPKIFLRWDAI